ncbi:MAG: hypothetical protein ACRDHP_15810, partial [Ktedonobacterales bacterium]
MVIGQAQCFLIAVVIGAAVGTRRGWNREVITSAILLATLMLLTLGGADTLATWLSHGFASTAQAHGIFASGGPQPDPVTQSPVPSVTSPAGACGLRVSSQALSTVIFAGMTWLGYGAGKKYGTAPKAANHRIAGAIPGGINGALIAYFVSTTVLPWQSV